MAQAAKKKKNNGHRHRAGKPEGLSYADMLAWQNSLQKKSEEFAKSETQRVLADRQAQRMAWLYIVALNEQFGFGPKRTEELEAAVKMLSEEYAEDLQENDQDYADEKLRKRVSRVRGHEVKYLYEDQYPVNKDLSGEEIAALRESENRIY